MNDADTDNGLMLDPADIDNFGNELDDLWSDDEDEEGETGARKAENAADDSSEKRKEPNGVNAEKAPITDHELLYSVKTDFSLDLDSDCERSESVAEQREVKRKEEENKEKKLPKSDIKSHDQDQVRAKKQMKKHINVQKRTSLSPPIKKMQKSRLSPENEGKHQRESSSESVPRVASIPRKQEHIARGLERRQKMEKKSSKQNLDSSASRLEAEIGVSSAPFDVNNSPTPPIGEDAGDVDALHDSRRGRHSPVLPRFPSSVQSARARASAKLKSSTLGKTSSSTHTPSDPPSKANAGSRLFNLQALAQSPLPPPSSDAATAKDASTKANVPKNVSIDLRTLADEGLPPVLEEGNSSQAKKKASNRVGKSGGQSGLTRPELGAVEEREEGEEEEPLNQIEPGVETEGKGEAPASLVDSTQGRDGKISREANTPPVPSSPRRQFREKSPKRNKVLSAASESSTQQAAAGNRTERKTHRRRGTELLISDEAMRWKTRCDSYISVAEKTRRKAELLLKALTEQRRSVLEKDQTIEDQKITIRTLKGRLTSAERQARVMDAKSGSFGTTLSDLNRQISKAEAERDEAKRKAEMELKDLRHKLAALYAEKAEVDTKLEHTTDDLKRITDDLKHVTEDLSAETKARLALEEEMKRMQGIKENRELALTTKASENRQRESQLSCELADKTRELEEQNGQVKKLQSDIKGVREELATERKLVEALKKALEAVSGKIEQQKMTLEATSDKLEQQKKALKAERAGMQNAVGQVRETIVSTLRREREQATRLKETLQAEIDSLKTRLKKMEEQRDAEAAKKQEASTSLAKCKSALEQLPHLLETVRALKREMRTLRVGADMKQEGSAFHSLGTYLDRSCRPVLVRSAIDATTRGTNSTADSSLLRNEGGVKVYCRLVSEVLAQLRRKISREGKMSPAEKHEVEVNMKLAGIDSESRSSLRKRLYDLNADYVFETGTRSKKIFPAFLPVVKRVVDGFDASVLTFSASESAKADLVTVGSDSSLYTEILKAAYSRWVRKEGRDPESNKPRKTKCYLQVACACYGTQFLDVLSTDSSKPHLKPHLLLHPHSLNTNEHLVRRAANDCRSAIRILHESRQKSRDMADSGSSGGNKDSSSRFYVIYLIVETVDQRGHIKEGRLTMVELASPMSLSAKWAKRHDLSQVKSVNQTLFAVSNVLAALQTDKGHIPYREAKLTLFLRGALRRSSLVKIIVCIDLDRPPAVEPTLKFVQTLCRNKLLSASLIPRKPKWKALAKIGDSQLKSAKAQSKRSQQHEDKQSAVSRSKSDTTEESRDEASPVRLANAHSYAELHGQSHELRGR